MPLPLLSHGCLDKICLRRRCDLTVFEFPGCSQGALFLAAKSGLACPADLAQATLAVLATGWTSRLWPGLNPS